MLRNTRSEASLTTAYTDTKIGKLPAGWKVASLEDVTDPSAPIRYGVVQTGADTPDGVPIVPIKHIRRISYATLHRASPEIEAAYAGSRIKGGDVLISVKGTIGDVGVVPSGFEGNIAREIARIRPKPNCDADFLSFQLQADHTQRRIDSKVVGSTRLEFSIHAVRDFLIALPPLPEQRKIAEILRTWDEAIEKLEALRAYKETLYSALADGLIFGTLGIDHRDWKLHRLGEITRELTRRNNDGNLGREVVMGVTNSRGIVPMREQTIGSDLTRYKILPPRAFAYNPMRINVGSIAMLRLSSDVLVSPDYVLFECISGKLDPDYLDHLRQSHFWAHYINAGGSGSVRMRTYYDDLAGLRLKLPGFAEQQRISAVLNAAQAEIALVTAEINLLTRQKRGLMQKLLTGKWRANAGGTP